MKSKATERSFRGIWKKVVNFNCGTLLLIEEGNNYNFAKDNLLLIACIIPTKRTKSLIGQAIKSARGMPWHQEPTKDVTSCDKPRVGANIH